MSHTYLGDFALKGADLRSRGLNRIGNMLVPNSNYCGFEDWVMPILDAMLAEQQNAGTRWTPSKVGWGAVQAEVTADTWFAGNRVAWPRPPNPLQPLSSAPSLQDAA